MPNRHEFLVNGCNWVLFTACSSVRLSRARRFFSFETSAVTLPKRSSIDVRPFLYANSDLHSLEDEGGAAISRLDHYTWKSEPLFAWDWSEEVWVQHYFSALSVRLSRE